ncbi:putative bifunctional diguanylate cyclase/phosphodiesterase [Flavimaricola marinus]|uniref:Cyclic di-GMP phosphodiesterase Gmr n=1 Tax=Flavimaricola marinus TaxID=1819565 RepID=A0A238LF13_9RHOB|nr:EAL domain-containing protein [Flavimaricola marinus]SMY07546.1 Cyclic di-GMP phosphodiesterase Gmr [Flavimaricola marinus]
MKQLRDLDSQKLHLQSLTEDLHRLSANALRLRSLAHQAGLVVMAAGLNLPNPRSRPAEIRRIMREVEATLADMRAAELTVLPRVGSESRQHIADALSPEALAPFDQLLVQLGQFNVDTANLREGRDLSRAELFRFISDELEAAVSAVEKAASSSLTGARTEDTNLAFVDDLTGLPNRRALYKLADERWSRQGTGRALTLMRLDLDLFKQINDSFGHAAGDYTLQRAAQIMQSQLRAKDFVARMGGDEFVMAFCGELSPETVTLRARKIIEKISEPFDYDGQTLTSSISIGIVNIRPGEPMGLDRMLHNADLALYAAKTNGRAQCHFYTSDLRTRHETNETLTAQISAGLQRGEFVPYFQPQVDGRSGALVGLEALVRWCHPERGVLTPYHFLDAARENGLLEALDEQITLAAVTALKEWRMQGLVVPQVSINISAQRLTKSMLGKELAAMVTDAGLSIDSIGLEILESAMIESGSVEMIETVRQLSNAGFKLELDDFGTGHASIANLRHFKVNRIKIDRSFIKDIHLHTDLSKITAAMIGLAHSLRIDALGEGVETPEERLILNALGVDHIQGFGVARPMPKDEVEGWIRRTQTKRVLPPRPAMTG